MINPKATKLIFDALANITAAQLKSMTPESREAHAVKADRAIKKLEAVIREAKDARAHSETP